MAARTAWKGFLKLSLLSVPVKAYTVNNTSGDIHLNQLHKECNSRVKYQKVCPIHGELSSDDIVSGYEYSKGQYVIVDPEEVDKLRSESDKGINIDTFVPKNTLDPVYFSGKSYYLVPDGPVAQQSFAVIVHAMEEEDKCAIARVVLHGKEQTILVRPKKKMLVVSILNYDAQINKPEQFQDQTPEKEVSQEELNLAKTLIQAQTKKEFNISEYKDIYKEKLTKLIEAKISGEEIVAQPAQEQAEIINLMDALKASVAKVQGETPEEASAKPPKKMAPSKAKTPAKKKKSS